MHKLHNVSVRFHDITVGRGQFHYRTTSPGCGNVHRCWRTLLLIRNQPFFTNSSASMGLKEIVNGTRNFRFGAFFDKILCGRWSEAEAFSVLFPSSSQSTKNVHAVRFVVGKMTEFLNHHRARVCNITLCCNEIFQIFDIRLKQNIFLAWQCAGTLGEEFVEDTNVVHYC